MKLKKLIPLRYRTKLIRRFGGAQLIRQSDGQHELVGGSEADRRAAYEWVSLFGHEIVFTHFFRPEPAEIHPPGFLAQWRAA